MLLPAELTLFVTYAEMICKKNLLRKDNQMEVNNDLKAEIIRRFGSQVVGANEMGIRENRLSYIVRGHTVPSNQEREALAAALGRATVRRLLRDSSTMEASNG